MVHRLSLHATVAPGDIRITLHTLSALTGMQPVRICTHSLVWVPRHEFHPVRAAGQPAAVDQYRLMLDRQLSDEPLQKFQDQVQDQVQDQAEETQKIKWTITVLEVPEAAKRKVTAQALLRTAVHESDPFALIKALGYRFERQHWLKGYRFVVRDVVLTVVQIHVAEPTIQLLDPSGRWLVRAHIDVAQLVDVEALAQASQQLERLQADLAGLFELRQPDRASLVTII